MSQTVVWVIATIVLSGLVVALAIWQERRAARKYEFARCPACGEEVGRDAYSTWHAHTRTAWRCRWESGPYLRCRRCGVGFRYTQSGELHAEQFEDAAARLTGRSTGPRTL